MDILTIASCQAPNMDFLCGDLAGYINARLGLPVELKMDVPWQERDRLLDGGKIDLCWICGLPYVGKVERSPGRIAPLVAPVMGADRYQNRPIYFSDVVVRRESPFRRLEDLRGASWAYNEPGSHSGYGVVRYTLVSRGLATRGNPETILGGGFFGQVIESGAHQNSLAMILRGEVDASAIDSTVLEQERANDPAIKEQIRLIDTFGPSPIPPWVVSDRMPAALRESLRALLVAMDGDTQGLAILQKARMSRFAAVGDEDYDPIREMARAASAISSNSPPPGTSRFR